MKTFCVSWITLLPLSIRMAIRPRSLVAEAGAAVSTVKPLRIWKRGCSLSEEPHEVGTTKPTAVSAGTRRTLTILIERLTFIPQKAALNWSCPALIGSEEHKQRLVRAVPRAIGYIEAPEMRPMIEERPL